MKSENKQISASKWTLATLLIISAVVLVMFYCVGFGDTIYSHDKKLTSPRYTDLLIIWEYALVAICIGSVLCFGIAAGIRNLKVKTKTQSRTGFAGWVFIFTFIVIAVSYFLSSSTPIRKGDGTLVETAWELQISDVCLLSIYVLVAVSIICSIISMLGIFKARK